MGRNLYPFFAGCALSAAAICAAPLAAESRKDTLAPSSQWNVDFAPDKCRLTRTFGDGEQKHLLFFEQYYPDDRAGMTVAGPKLNRFRSSKRTSLSFFAEQETIRTEPFVGDVEGFGTAVIYSSVSLEYGTGEGEDKDETLPQLDTAFADKAEYVGLTQGSQSVYLQTGPLGEAFKVLNQCTQSLIEGWGLDAKKHVSATRLPRWENEGQVSKRIARSYPSAALSRGEQGIMRMRVIVDEAGSVTDCVINEATTTDRLKSPACREMMKAKFSPALDAEGNAFKSFYATSIIYRMG